MQFYIILGPKAKERLREIKEDPSKAKQYKAVEKALKLLEQNPRHPSLNTHEHTSLSRQFGKKVYEAYAENHTPGAYRIFWYYGANKGEIQILTIIPHP